jgi:hypothetical protein
VRFGRALLAALGLTLSVLAGCSCPDPANEPRCTGPFGDGLWPDVCWNAYADSSPFNMEIPENPTVLPNSTAIVQRVLGDISRQNRPNNVVVPENGNGGEPTYYSTGDDPLFTIHCRNDPDKRPDGACPVENDEVRVPAGAVAEAGPDHHVAIIDQRVVHNDANWEYDLWKFQHFVAADGSQQNAAPATGGQIITGWAGRIDFDAKGITPVAPSGQFSGNTTAAFFGGMAGRVRWEDFAGGGQFQVNHALNITIECADGSSPAVFPSPPQAKAQACSRVPVNPNDPNCVTPNDPSCPKLPDTDAPPLGSLFQLNMTESQIGALKIRSWKKAWLQAMATYGMYFGDTGAEGYFAFETEAGSQYTSLGSWDRALSYANDNHWELGQNNDRIGRFYNNGYDQNQGPAEDRETIDWDTDVWSHLRVLDPCVPAGTCPGIN